jgi:hypothetical protein
MPETPLNVTVLLLYSLVFNMSEGKKRFTGDSMSTLYYLWKRNQLPKDLQQDSASPSLPTPKILFQAVTVPGHEGIFGNSTRRWSDGWQIRGTSRASSPRKDEERCINLCTRLKAVGIPFWVDQRRRQYLLRVDKHYAVRVPEEFLAMREK